MQQQQQQQEDEEEASDEGSRATYGTAVPGTGAAPHRPISGPTTVRQYSTVPVHMAASGFDLDLTHP